MFKDLKINTYKTKLEKKGGCLRTACTVPAVERKNSEPIFPSVQGQGWGGGACVFSMRIACRTVVLICTLLPLPPTPSSSGPI